MKSKASPDVVAVPESRCLGCGAPMNMLGTASTEAAKPQSGDNAVCIKCGAVMKLDDDLRLRGMTPEEMDELVVDREQMDTIARMVRRVHFIRHSSG